MFVLTAMGVVLMFQWNGAAVRRDVGHKACGCSFTWILKPGRVYQLHTPLMVVLV